MDPRLPDRFDLDGRQPDDGSRAERRGRDRARGDLSREHVSSHQLAPEHRVLPTAGWLAIRLDPRSPIVERIDRGDRAGAEALARGFYGSLFAIAGVACIVLALAGPFILRVFTVGVADPASAALERKIGLLFFFLFIPQIVCYLTAGTSGAAMNASGRFALAAGAPAIENAGMITTLILVALIFGTGTPLASVTTGEVLLLGLGTTASVALHATATWLGASQ